MPVQVNGRMSNMEAINKIADKHGLLVLEDSAQALGARFQGKAAGANSNWGVFSFYPAKVLGTFGDAGALVTNDDAIAEKVRLMRNHGASELKQISSDVEIWGTNCRMDNIHAAFLSYKMDWYEEVVTKRRHIAQMYSDAFSSIAELRLPPAPTSDGDHFDVYQNYEVCTSQRDELKVYLADANIGTIIQWGGLALHHFEGLGMSGKLPKTEKFFEECLLLPMNHFLTDDQVSHVISKVTEFFNRS